MLFKTIFKKIYESEISCRIEWLYDSGFTWCLLDNSYPRILKDDEFDNKVKICCRTEDDFIKANNRTHEKDWIVRGSCDDIEDALCELYDAIILHFPNSKAGKWLADFDKNRKHFMICPGCGDIFDMRDLGNVFEHEHGKTTPVVNGFNYSAKKIGDSVEWNKGKKIDLN